jgi:hypothetical protein
MLNLQVASTYVPSPSKKYYPVTPRVENALNFQGRKTKFAFSLYTVET